MRGVRSESIRECTGLHPARGGWSNSRNGGRDALLSGGVSLRRPPSLQMASAAFHRHASSRGTCCCGRCTNSSPPPWSKRVIIRMIPYVMYHAPATRIPRASWACPPPLPKSVRHPHPRFVACSGWSQQPHRVGGKRQPRVLEGGAQQDVGRGRQPDSHRHIAAGLNFRIDGIAADADRRGDDHRTAAGYRSPIP